MGNQNPGPISELLLFPNLHSVLYYSKGYPFTYLLYHCWYTTNMMLKHSYVNTNQNSTIHCTYQYSLHCTIHNIVHCTVHYTIHYALNRRPSCWLSGPIHLGTLSLLRPVHCTMLYTLYFILHCTVNCTLFPCLCYIVLKTILYTILYT